MVIQPNAETAANVAAMLTEMPQHEALAALNQILNAVQAFVLELGMCPCQAQRFTLSFAEAIGDHLASLTPRTLH